MKCNTKPRYWADAFRDRQGIIRDDGYALIFHTAAWPVAETTLSPTTSDISSGTTTGGDAAGGSAAGSRAEPLLFLSKAQGAITVQHKHKVN